MSKLYDALSLQVRRSPWKLLGLALMAFIVVIMMIMSAVFALAESRI